jgi:cysteine-rich repeat protein
VSGDGCSSDCLTVETDALCADASSLQLGATTPGNTANGVDGLMSSCQAGLARANLFDVTPPGRGRLRLHLTSPTTQTLSLRTTCTDPASELGCRSDFGLPTDQELILQITDAAPAPLSVMVSAMTILEQGPYSLEAEFRPEQCGDSVIAGREVCDDGNAVGNDGCSADCFTIEYNVHCTQAPALSTTATNAGTLAGAPALFGASCASDENATIHPTRLYRFTAPAAGNLHLKLQDGSSFAVLSVRDGCGVPSATPELSCRPAFLDGELDVALTAGQSITAAVVSYRIDRDLGTYTLDATFTPN